MNEVAILNANVDFVSKSLNMSIEVKDANDITEDIKIGKLPTPLNPVILPHA